MRSIALKPAAGSLKKSSLFPRFLRPSSLSLSSTRPSRVSASKITATLNRPPSRTALENIFWNRELLQGDAIMVACTLFASSRVPVLEVPYLLLCMVFSFVLVATVRGDYTREGDPNAGLNDLAQKTGMGMFQGVLNACLTWWFYCIVCTLLWSMMYFPEVQSQSSWIDFGVRDFRGVPPFVETIVAQALTLSCWRGLAALFFIKEDK